MTSSITPPGQLSASISREGLTSLLSELGQNLDTILVLVSNVNNCLGGTITRTPQGEHLADQRTGLQGIVMEQIALSIAIMGIAHENTNIVNN